MAPLARSVTIAALAALALAPSASAERALGIVSPSSLIAFDTATPATATITKIINLGSGETVLGIDKRPAVPGQVMIWTVPAGTIGSATMKAYTLDPATGIATVVGSGAATASPPGAADVKTGFDFNPLVDRVRVALSNNENFRMNPNNGTLAGDDTNITYGA